MWWNFSAVIEPKVGFSGPPIFTHRAQTQIHIYLFVSPIVGGIKTLPTTNNTEKFSVNNSSDARIHKCFPCVQQEQSQPLAHSAISNP